jgi:solute carrier family 20 (sodium-dependent phosphate transporter)
MERHTIIGGILGCCIATIGFQGINWGFHDGVSQVFVLWGIAPVVSAVFSAFIFQLIKHLVMDSDKPVRWALVALPFFYAITGAMLTSKLHSNSSTFVLLMN